ncbi:hypothetical protein P9314_15100 [Paenibacillus validus]|uniref:Uncharacterized protein n=1 Tax=Paenibacillus validus TaxID=44253 RepID=A0A7X2ZGX2_9BACL|nr:hypothetical protein [Paenibacillus validus]MED4602022.1 hypothetical protein [Paenibacillus validus]MED4605384.1 hypothetical protein [Paenibacillus validus]MUG74048.1 hypothetical protein [Paenibacillus validus]
MVHYTVETKLNVHDAVNTLEKVLKSEQFGVLWQFDIRTYLNELMTVNLKQMCNRIINKIINNLEKFFFSNYELLGLMAVSGMRDEAKIK